MITNTSKLLASKNVKNGKWLYINKDLYNMFDDEGDVFLESEIIEGELFLYEPIDLMGEKFYCLNRGELK